MSHKRLLIVATIIAAIVLAGFALSVPHTRDESGASAALPKSDMPSVALRDSFRKGVHTIMGSITAPNPCTSVTATASPIGDPANPTGITVAVAMPAESGVCLERSTDVPFTATVAAPARLPITTSVNGLAATTTDL